MMTRTQTRRTIFDVVDGHDDHNHGIRGWDPIF